jgi:hypothetical protein
MKKLILSLGGAALLTVMIVGAVGAVGPTPTPDRGQVRDRDTIATVLGLTQPQVMELRHDGLSLTQIAERQKVEVQKLIDALASRWSTRIDARVANGALSADEATKLKSQVEQQARTMVEKTTLGGMRGAAVGAGPASGVGNGLGANGTGAGNGPRGTGTGTGECDGSGPHGAGRT